MAYTETTSKNIFQRFFNSIGGIIFGLILFIVSFGVLFWNEGRFDNSILAREAVEISATQQSTDNQGELVAVTGEIEMTQQIADGLFLVSDKYLAIRRNVEIFATIENVDSNTQTNLGGTQETTTTYTYTTGWTNNPQDSSKFKETPQIPNPKLPFSSETIEASEAKLGIYQFNPSNAGYPSMDKLFLDSDLVNLQEGYIIENNYIFKGANNLNNPQIGDIRISYEVSRPNSEVTLFGKKDAQEIKRYTAENGKSLYTLRPGDKDQAVSSLKNEHKTMTWVLRVVGFLMMWFGLQSILAPLSVIADVIPFLGNLSRGIIGIITFVVALVLSFVTILIGVIFSNIWLLIGTIVIICSSAGFIFYRKSKTKPKNKE